MSQLPITCVIAACLVIGGASTACGATSSVRQGGSSSDAGVRPAVLPVDAGADVVSFPTYAPSPPVKSTPPASDHGPYPIVLMHGLAGFNQLANIPLNVSYFNGVQADLEVHDAGAVFVTVAPPFENSEDRAKALAPQLDSILTQTGAQKLNLIGHSQGGLDARVLVSPAGCAYANRVASVTTISTPHYGTKVADAALGLTGNPVSSTVTDALLNLLEQGVYSVDAGSNTVEQLTNLSTSYMINVFNPKYPDAPGVVYASYAGRTNLETGDGICNDGVYANQPRSLDVAQPVMQTTADYLWSQGETNDGLVPVYSTKWGTFLECVPADHLKECGMIRQNGPDPISGFDHLVFFRAVVARLRAQGL